MAMEFAEKLREARKKFNFSQKTLADRLGLKPPTISKYEHGIAFPSPEVLEKLCEFFHWDVGQIFQIVYREKVPESAKPFLENFPASDEKSPKQESLDSYDHPGLLNFLQDSLMPNPTESELDVLISVKIKGKEPTKWFYKFLLDSLRNEGLVKKKADTVENLSMSDNR